MKKITTTLNLIGMRNNERFAEELKKLPSRCYFFKS